MHAAQRLERSVANAVVATGGNRRTGTRRPVRSRTLGQLLRDLGKPPTVRPGLEHDLELALHQRNWLAHGYFRYSGGGPCGVSRSASSLEELAAGFERLAKELASLVKTFGWESPVGDRYYLHGKTLRLKNTGEVEIAYFASDLRDGALREMPAGKEIVVNARTGLPLLKKTPREDNGARPTDVEHLSELE